jgi:hypothetical protein
MQKKCGEEKAKTEFQATIGQPVRLLGGCEEDRSA